MSTQATLQAVFSSSADAYEASEGFTGLCARRVETEDDCWYRIARLDRGALAKYAELHSSDVKGLKEAAREVTGWRGYERGQHFAHDASVVVGRFSVTVRQFGGLDY